MSSHRQHHFEIVESFDPAEFAPGTRNKLRLSMVGNGLGGLISIPIVVLRGVEDGPTVGTLDKMRIIMVRNMLSRLASEQADATGAGEPESDVASHLNMAV